MASEHDDRVRDRAYHLWQENGGEHGKEMEHWLQAEREVSGMAASAASGTSAVAKPKAAPKASGTDRPAAQKAAAKASAPGAAVKKAPKVEPAESKATAPAKAAKPRSAKSPA